MDYLVLSLVWIAWCTLHSLMIARFILEACETTMHKLCRFHRLFYNIIAIITFIAANIYARGLPRTTVYEFSGAGEILRISVLIVSVLLFIGGALGYDMFHFSGIRQIFSNDTHRVLTNTGEFKADGLLTITRHPWYLAALLLIWSSSSSVSDVDLVARIIFTLYLFIGTYLEERKLVRQFGDSYKIYQKDVSMLFPVKWLGTLIKR
jgi:protein-S-isoprenylcysteine O-methyltransferase Ste14